MPAEQEDLPDDVEELKRMLRAARGELTQERAERAVIEEKLRLANAALFGRRSEVLEDANQTRLFDEIETELDRGPELFADAETKVAAHTRRPRGRRVLPEYLPRKQIVHDVPEDERVCGCGADLTRIGEEVAEKLEIIPAQVFVERHVRPKYACRACKGEDADDDAVKIAPAAPQILPKSLAGPGLLAYLLVGKFQDSLPLYRMERIFQRMEVDLSRQTMSNWFIALHERLRPLLRLLRDELFRGPVVAVDETPVQVLGESGRSNTTKSYMWVIRAGPPERPVVWFEYRPTRSAAFLGEWFAGYDGALLTDGYAGYNELGARAGIAHAGCWDHARRKFVEARKVAPESEAAKRALSLIGELYRVERIGREKLFAPEELFALRRQRSGPSIAQLREFLDERIPLVAPKTVLGEALAYASRQWPKLTRFLDDGAIPLSNILVENDIRPFAIGRKNWLCVPRRSRGSKRLRDHALSWMREGPSQRIYRRTLQTA